MSTEDRAKLVEALFEGYKVLGFDTDGDRTGAEMLSHTGLGGNDLEAYIKVCTGAFAEARADHDEAIGVVR